MVVDPGLHADRDLDLYLHDLPSGDGGGAALDLAACQLPDERVR